MKINLNKIIDEELPVEHRIVNLSLALGVMLTVCANIANLLNGVSYLIILVVLISGIIWAWLLYLSLTRGLYVIPLYVGSGVFLFVLTPILWIFNGGVLGSFPYYVVIFSATASILALGPRRWLFVLCPLAVVAILIAVECKYPFIVKGYVNHSVRFIDVTLAVVLAVAGNTFFAAAIASNFDKEREKISKSYERVQYLATHDPLTKIPNRYYLEQELKRSIAKAKEGNKSTLLFIDLDNFKLINDAFGHVAGDEVLTALVTILRSNLCADDLLARFGGDEFAILLEETTIENGRIVAEKLRRTVEEVEMRSFHLTISIGVVSIDGSLDSKKLLSLADTALYQAKERGRNTVVILEADEDLGKRHSYTNKIVGLLKSSLRQNNFLLLFQPIVGLQNGVTIYHEVLARLKDKEEGLISPTAFIPVAEQFGLMPQIDRCIFQAALAYLNRYPHLKLFINLSGMSLGDEELLEFIRMTILNNGIDPSRIGFEITETAAVKDLVNANLWIHRIRNLGCYFALDDFGKGFSSFSYLRELPVDYLKIDGCFVKNIDKDYTNKALIQAMQSMAHALGMKTIAEFVENESILEALREINIDFGQGYFLGRPAPLPWETSQSPQLNRSQFSRSPPHPDIDKSKSAARL